MCRDNLYQLFLACTYVGREANFDPLKEFRKIVTNIASFLQFEHQLVPLLPNRLNSLRYNSYVTYNVVSVTSHWQNLRSSGSLQCHRKQLTYPEINSNEHN